jgi:hypothetical protein
MATHHSLLSAKESEFLLLVEGPSDLHAVVQLVRLVHKAEPSFVAIDCKNDDGVLDQLSIRLVQPEPAQKTVGLILDADIDGSTEKDAVRRRWAQLKNRIGANYAFPEDFPEEGLIIDPRPGRRAIGTLPRIGAWLMPNNKAFGMFEDLLLDSLGDREKSYTSDVVKQAKTDNVATFQPSHLSKAAVRTYMAWQEPPDLPHLSFAIRQGHFQKHRGGMQAIPRLAWRALSSSDGLTDS